MQKNDLVSRLIDQALKKPMGDSWTYRSQDEFHMELVKLVCERCMLIVYKDHEITLGQAYELTKKIKKEFSV